ncbi:MAG: MNIO family bufferin maturase [Candidatus Binatia bacterium]
MSGAPPKLRGVGLGLRSPHVGEILATSPRAPWFEVVAENYLNPGPRALEALGRIRSSYPLALHAVSMTLGSVDPLDEEYLDTLAALVARFEPEIVSDYACWTGVGGVNSHDLLPLPFREDVVRHCAARILRVQERLGRRILVENVSSYLAAPGSEMPEWEFLAALAETADSGILLDVNNVYVSSVNHGFDPVAYIEALPPGRVLQLHLAGHEAWDGMLLDSHGAPVADDVLRLHERTCVRFGPVPALLEWDRNLPHLETLLAERDRIEAATEAASGVLA